jgi:hypothetical protein
MFLSTGM